MLNYRFKKLRKTFSLGGVREHLYIIFRLLKPGDKRKILQRKKDILPIEK